MGAIAPIKFRNPMIENERKLLLAPDSATKLLNELKKLPDFSAYDVTQGYLSGSARIRHTVPHNKTSNEKYLFTYKTKVSGNTVEIETSITVHDFQKLFLIAKPVILKTRLKFVDQEKNHTWDIDFLKTPKSGDIYLAMAEVEMPEFEVDLPEILPVLQPYVVKWIDMGDKRFNNRNLHNSKKVASLVRSIVDASKTS